MYHHLVALQQAREGSGIGEFDLETLPTVARVNNAIALTRVTGQVASLVKQVQGLTKDALTELPPERRERYPVLEAVAN